MPPAAPESRPAWEEEPADDALENRRELAALFLRQIWAIGPGYLIAGGMTAWVLWPGLGAAAVPWLGLLAAVVLVRHAMAWHHRARLAAVDGDTLRRMETGHIVMAAITGLTWGIVPWLEPGGVDLTADLFVAAVVIGITGGAAPPLTPLRLAFPAFATASLLPLCIRFISYDTDIHLGIGLAGLVFLLILIYYQRNTHRTLEEAIRLRRRGNRLLTALAAEKRAAEEAARVKSLFLAGVSHDLQHPLHSLGLYLGYLKALPAQDMAEGFARAGPGMEQTVADMGNMLVRLVELARLEEHAVRPVLAEVALDELFQQCRERHVPLARNKGLRLHFVPTRSVIETDPALMRSILDNLVANALRHTERGGVVVGARPRAGAIALQVWDSGCGIAPDALERVFEAYRGFDDRRGAGRGHGLGLAIVRRQCELLGYRIEAHSRPGIGSLFTVTLSRRPTGR